MFVKVCGLGTTADIDVAVAAGADAVGLVISGTSVRGLDRDQAVRLAAHVPPGVLSVLVVNDTPAVEAARIAAELGFGALQLHGTAYGEEDFAAAAAVFPRLWRATSLSDRPDTRVGAYGEEVLLLDSPARVPASRGTCRCSNRPAPRARGCSRAGSHRTTSPRRSGRRGPGASTCPAASSPPRASRTTT